MTVKVGLIGAGVMGADHAATIAGAVAGVERLGLGKFVLCEKPLAPTVAECLEIVARESALGRRLVQVGFMRRFDPRYVAMKRALDASEIGAPLLMHCVHRNRTAPSFIDARSLITSSAVHEIDIVRWLFGREITRASVVASRPTSRGQIRDPQLVLLQLADDVLVDVEVFVNAQYGYDVRGELGGETGTISLAAPAAVSVRSAGSEGFRRAPDWRERFAEAYRAQLQAWIGAVGSGASAGASAWDGYAAMAVAEACLGSLGSGQPTEVRLEPRPALYE